jgi:23S rRNA (guanosine2251-2'-O)-methyltransferase
MKRTKKRGDLNLLAIEGRNPVLEALRAGVAVKRFFISSTIRRDGKIDEILSRARFRGVKAERVSRRFLDRRSPTGLHQGVIVFAELSPPPSLSQLLKKAESEKRDPFFLVFPSLMSEQNLGAAVRTAEAAAVDAVLLPSRSFGITPVVARTSTGACFWLPLIQTNLFNALKKLAAWGVTVVGAEMKSDRLYWSVDWTGPVALVIGGENRGLSDPVRKYCQSLVGIPMLGKGGSLNLSVATAVILYERVRQLSV